MTALPGGSAAPRQIKESVAMPFLLVLTGRVDACQTLFHHALATFNAIGHCMCRESVLGHSLQQCQAMHRADS
jgi:hypothetical protein